MSRAGAKAKRARPQAAVRAECPTCHRGVVHHIRQPERGRMSYVDMHAVVCGCDHSIGSSYCNFGDGWLEAA